MMRKDIERIFSSKGYYLFCMILNIPAIIVIPVEVFYYREHVETIILILWALICLYEYHWWKRFRQADH